MQQNFKIVIGALVLLTGIACFTNGCREYGAVNAVTYQYGKALYSACNARSHDRLDLCLTMIETAEDNHEISGTEAAYLRGITAKAQAEEWDAAQAMARQLMVDQVDR